jgi:predicted nucleic acid-binding protein
MILTDAGPLIALVDRGEPEHKACVACLADFTGPRAAFICMSPRPHTAQPERSEAKSKASLPTLRLRRSRGYAQSERRSTHGCIRVKTALCSRRGQCLLKPCTFLEKQVAGMRRSRCGVCLSKATWLSAPQGTENYKRMRTLMHKYRDRPMDLADASLVCLAEQQGLRKIFTLDKEDFRIYRLHGRRTFDIWPAE